MNTLHLLHVLLTRVFFHFHVYNPLDMKDIINQYSKLRTAGLPINVQLQKLM